MSETRTKRRYAHEIYPHADEWETRPLAVEVPYLLAQAVGMETSGTGWMRLHDKGEHREANARIHALVDAQRLAFLADALHQGMTGDEAWSWADQRCNSDQGGEWIWERAKHYGVNAEAIKPYPCGPEADHHYHYGPLSKNGWSMGSREPGPESACPDCTEQVSA